MRFAILFLRQILTLLLLRRKVDQNLGNAGEMAARQSMEFGVWGLLLIGLGGTGRKGWKGYLCAWEATIANEDQPVALLGIVL